VGWQAFLSHGPSPYLVAEVIPRSNTELPACFVPWAPAIVIASDYLLRAAGFQPNRPEPMGWSQDHPDAFRKAKYRNRLKVRGCGTLWTVEREMEEVLVFRYGSLPVFTRTHQAAKYLAEYCQRPEPGEGSTPRPRGVASGLHWVIWTPDGIAYC
jgi:hypothetical protein